ncbi:7452_t:CDS:2, partial [Cetraspora pellucida]
STKPTIPYGKITMKVETHWSVIKKHYLHWFNQLRLDLLVWTLFTENFKKEWIYAGASDERQAEIRVSKRNNHNFEDNNVTLPKAQVILQIVEDHDVETIIDNSSENYNINIDEDSYEKTHSYVESNWKLFTQTFE